MCVCVWGGGGGVWGSVLTSTIAVVFYQLQ